VTYSRDIYINKSIKVCILTSVHYAIDIRIFHKEAKSLVNAGYDVILIGQYERNTTISGMKLVALRKPTSRFTRFFFTTLKVFFRALRQKADIFHLHDPELIPIGLLLKILGKKVIYDVHEDYGKSILSKFYIPKYLRKIASQLSDLIEKFASTFFDGIVGATDAISEKFAHTGKSIAIRNFPILSKFANVALPPKVDNSFNIIYAGVLVEDRGISEIVKAMEHLSSSNNIKLTLCGKFVPEEYEEKVKVLNGFERTEYLGWVDQEDVWVRLMKANVGIICCRPIPNAIKAQPNKMFDYMAAGLPIIASNFPLWEDIIKESACGITVDPLNPKEIAKAIQYLKENPDEARKMGENGRKAVLGKYNWQNEEKKLLKLYRDLITA